MAEPDVRVTLAALGLASLVLGPSACTRGAPDPSNVAARERTTGALASPKGAADPALADPLVGTKPPPWTTDEWVNSPPLTMEGLRGRVVLVRWFMSPTCPMCSATAPSLRQLHRDYASQGLTVVGMYHHKEDGPLKDGEYASYVKSYGFEFPVARDPEWTTLKAWWLGGHERDYTSVSFLIDRSGTVRGIHQGGRYAPGDADYAAMKRAIEKLLAE